MNKITELELSNNALVSFDDNNLSSIVKINLQNNLLVDFVSAVSEDNKLEYLNLAGNLLENFNENTFPYLKTLVLTNNSKFDNFTKNVLPGLTSLDLDGSYILEFHDNNLASLTSLILRGHVSNFNNNTLTNVNYLDLTGNDIGSIPNLENYKKLKNLILSDNSFTVFSGYKLPELLSLYLDSNHIGQFRENEFPLIEVIDLSDNEIEKI